MPLIKIDENIFRFPNQFFYGEPVGTYLIDLADKAILVDLPTYSSEIELHLRSLKKPVVAILSHGPCGIKDGTDWQRKLGVKIYLHQADSTNEWLSLKPDYLYSHSLKIDSSIKIIFTPGHTPGSICLLHQESKTIFTGDTFAGNKNGSVRDFLTDPDANGDLSLRLKSCKKLLKFDFDKILPFHYEMILKEGKERLGEFIEKYSNRSQIRVKEK